MPVSCVRETRRRLSRPHTAGYSRRTALPAPVVEAKEKLVNDRHPSGSATAPAPASGTASTPCAPYGTQEAVYGDFTAYGAHGTTGFHTGAHDTGGFPVDPLFGAVPADGAQATGSYDTVHWPSGDHGAPYHDPYTAQQHTVHDTGAYGMTAWTTGYQQQPFVPPQSGPVDTGGQWDASVWPQPDQQAADSTQQWDWGTQFFDTGAYDATQWNSDGAAAPAEDLGEADPHDRHAPHDSHDPHGAPPSAREEPATGEMPAVPQPPDDEEETAADPVPAPRAASRSRRRSPAKRSALLTVAVPSVCVMGVAGIAAASVGGLADEDKDTSATAADTHTVKASEANAKLDLQLRNVSAGADDFAGRASRYQERIDLKAKQAAELRKAAEEAARRERLRPKFALPVLPKGLSAFFGQAGVNWMSAHTGIDFPVPYGTPVLAATDGTVRTQWNSAYGNMMIVTAMDGTETWYCHLSSYQVPSGTTVKAGQPIAFSGNSGNSTGPHLHFEVRPAGGSPIDPLAWLRSHGLNPL
ncbi:peptidoglycan DD-metalloendopeptidase family protein [Streptomyces thermogriseus]|uniref:M23 family metallopeptidase n=1 Tax=Streptomyces thermogriseus TaxID=75292 RepID=UPI0031F856A8